MRGGHSQGTYLALASLSKLRSRRQRIIVRVRLLDKGILEERPGTTFLIRTKNKF